MRKPHKTLLLSCTLFFTHTMALNLPLSIDVLAPPTSTSPTANVTNFEQPLPHAPTKTMGLNTCYPSTVPVSHDVWENCSRAISKIPQEDTPRIFETSDFPMSFEYGGCVVTLTLPKKDVGTWLGVDWAVVHLWMGCQTMYPRTLRGATGVAGFYGNMFVRVWYEGTGNAAESGVTAREIGEDGVERVKQFRTRNLIEEG